MTIGDQYRAITPRDQFILNSDGAIVGIRSAQSTGDEMRVLTLAQLAAVQEATPDGGAFALSEAHPVVAATATATAFTGACEFGGITVRAISGAPQTVTVYDATSATGTAIAVFTVSAVGSYPWLGDWTTPGVGAAGSRVNDTGCHIVISGGTSRTIDVMVG